MAAGSLLALLDDISTVLDDVAILGKVAAKKTAGVLGDDLALNAQQVVGLTASRELPVVWAVAKGSFVNKLILVPAALAIGSLLPWAITPLLMIGGAYLCFEGFEKLVHRSPHAAQHGTRTGAGAEPAADPQVDTAALERDRVRGAIRTDFILSAEIVAISLGIVADAPFVTQALVMSSIAIGMTVGVYGVVAGIVKLDDLGLYWTLTEGDGPSAVARRRAGALLLRAAPWLMKGLSIVGTAAMFLVGGGILTHGVPPLHHAIVSLTEAASAAWPGAAPLLELSLPLVADALVGIAAGAVVLGVVRLLKRAGSDAPEAVHR